MNCVRNVHSFNFKTLQNLTFISKYLPCGKNAFCFQLSLETNFIMRTIFMRTNTAFYVTT